MLCLFLICRSDLYILLCHMLMCLSVLKQEHGCIVHKKKKKKVKQEVPSLYLLAVLCGPIVNFMQHLFYGCFGRGPSQFGCLLCGF